MIKQKVYKFLVHPRYRILRHMLLISIFTLLACRRIFFIYHDNTDVLGSTIYSLCIITTAVYLLSIYTNLYFLIPQFLLKKKYLLYLAGLLFLALMPLAYQLGQEYIVRTMLDLPHKIESYFSPLIFIANSSSFITILICIVGTSIPSLFKTRMEENIRMNTMEQEHIKSELERLKRQISPDFLSNILRRCSVLVKTDSDRASDMLMRLGDLLRYQLYDCNRQKVLLSAEINFIKNYLHLKKLYCDKFTYEFTIGTVKEIFIPPLLFSPVIQHTANEVSNTSSPVLVKFSLELIGDNLLFTSQSKNGVNLPPSEHFALKKRLNILYPKNFILKLTHDKATLQINNISGYE